MDFLRLALPKARLALLTAFVAGSLAVFACFHVSATRAAAAPGAAEPATTVPVTTVPVLDNDTPETLHARIQIAEHERAHSGVDSLA